METEYEYWDAYLFRRKIKSSPSQGLDIECCLVSSFYILP